MTEETYTFDQARARLEEIARQAKDASLDKSLDLLEEGVRLANICTERIDHTRWRDEVEEGQGTEESEEVESPVEGQEDE